MAINHRLNNSGDSVWSFVKNVKSSILKPYKIASFILPILRAYLYNIAILFAIMYPMSLSYKMVFMLAVAGFAFAEKIVLPLVEKLFTMLSKQLISSFEKISKIFKRKNPQQANQIFSYLEDNNDREKKAIDANNITLKLRKDNSSISQTIALLKSQNNSTTNQTKALLSDLGMISSSIHDNSIEINNSLSYCDRKLMYMINSYNHVMNDHLNTANNISKKCSLLSYKMHLNNKRSQQIHEHLVSINKNNNEILSTSYNMLRTLSNHQDVDSFVFRSCRSRKFA